MEGSYNCLGYLTRFSKKDKLRRIPTWYPHFLLMLRHRTPFVCHFQPFDWDLGLINCTSLSWLKQAIHTKYKYIWSITNSCIKTHRFNGKSMLGIDFCLKISTEKINYLFVRVGGLKERMRTHSMFIIHS